MSQSDLRLRRKDTLHGNAEVRGQVGHHVVGRLAAASGGWGSVIRLIGVRASKPMPSAAAPALVSVHNAHEMDLEEKKLGH